MMRYLVQPIRFSRNVEQNIPFLERIIFENLFHFLIDQTTTKSLLELSPSLYIISGTDGTEYMGIGRELDKILSLCVCICGASEISICSVPSVPLFFTSSHVDNYCLSSSPAIVKNGTDY